VEDSFRGEENKADKTHCQLSVTRVGITDTDIGTQP
jgi:hypothetical protein